jgi:hypothetical protein
MNKRWDSLTKILKLVLLVSLIFGIAAGTASAFSFRGYTYDVNKSALNNTTVIIEEYSLGPGSPPILIANYSNSSNMSGYFNIKNIPDNVTSSYNIILRHFNGTTLDYIGQSLPVFPYNMILSLAMDPKPINFNLRNGGTINITAINETGVRKNFRYTVKDKKLGYPVADNFGNEVSGAVLYVPANRNYSIMIYPNQSFPISYDLDNLTTSNNYIDVTFNTSVTLRRVIGHVNLSDGSDHFSDLKIIAYLMEPGNMISQDHPLPYNMSAMKCSPICESDIYNPASGNYNISLPGAAMNANLLLFATAYNSTSGNYSGSFRTILLNYSNSPVTGFNFSLQQLLGTQSIISLNNASIMGPPGLTNITTKK